MANDREARDLRPYMLNAPAFDFPPATAAPPAAAAAANNRPPGRGGLLRAIQGLHGPHSTQAPRISHPPHPPITEADLRAVRLHRRRTRDHQRRMGANGVTAAWSAVGRSRHAGPPDAGNAEDDPELPSPLFQSLNPSPPSNRRQRRWVDNWTPDLLHSDSDSEPVDRYRLNKRRKLVPNAPEPMIAPIKYGWLGQVDAGLLRLYINHCDGGEINPRSAGYVNYSAENVLRNDLSVYCSKSSRCNLMLGHHADTIFHLDKLIVQAPTMTYDAPIQHGMLFVGMDSEKLLRGAEPYCNAYPENDLHSPDDPEGSGPETAPRTGVLPPPPPGVSVEYYRLQRAGRRPPDNEDVNREPESSSEDGSVVLPDGIDMGENDGRNDSEAEETEANIRRSRRMAYVLGNIRDDDWPERAAMSEGLVGMSVPPLGSVPLREATGPPGPPFSYDLDAFLFQPPMYDYMSRRRPHQQTRAADETISIGSGGSGGGGTGYPRSSPFPGASAASLTEPSAPPPSPGFSSENRAGAASQRVDELGFKAKFIIDHEQSRAIIKFNPPISGRYILLKLFSAMGEAENIDVQHVAAYGWSGPRYFPAVEIR